MASKELIIEFLSKIFSSKNYDIFSIIDINNSEINKTVDSIDIIKYFFDNTDRKELYNIKTYYENIFYNNLDNKLFKLYYIVILYIGNKNYNRKIIWQHVYHYFQYLNSLDEDIIELEKRFENLKTDINYDCSSDEDNHNNFTPINTKKKVGIFK